MREDGGEGRGDGGPARDDVRAHGEKDVRWGKGSHSRQELIARSLKPVSDGQDVRDVVEGGCGGCPEHAAHLPNGIVLGHLERASESLLIDTCIP